MRPVRSVLLSCSIKQHSAETIWIKPDNKEVVKVNKVTIMELHERYGYISFDTLKSLVEE